MENEPVGDRQQIEKKLLEAVEAAREAYNAGTRTRDEYAKALKALNDFVVRGILPPKQAASGSD